MESISNVICAFSDLLVSFLDYVNDLTLNFGGMSSYLTLIRTYFITILPTSQFKFLGNMNRKCAFYNLLIVNVLFVLLYSLCVY